MILITPNDIFNLLGSVTCETDLREIEHYVLSNLDGYSVLDGRLFLQAINMLDKIFEK